MVGLSIKVVHLIESWKTFVGCPWMKMHTFSGKSHKIFEKGVSYERIQTIIYGQNDLDNQRYFYMDQ